jgi:putative holliday junction resolvase
MRCLALDVGDERIGVAISDARGYLARPLEVIARKAGPSSFLRLAEVIAAQGVEQVVVGLPLLADGSEGKQVRSCRAYVAGLVKYVSVPIVWYDERGTTRRATEILAENNASRRHRRQSSDQVAAAVILQHYLDELAGGPR